VQVPVGAGVTAFQVTGEVDSSLRVSLEKITDPNGDEVLYWEDWWEDPKSLTWSFFGFDPVTATNWPVRDVDGPLIEGTWTVQLGITEPDYTYAPGADVRVSVMTKTDDDFSEGRVKVQIVWADGIDDLPDVVDAVEVAVERWREVWGPYGLSLDVEYLSSDLPADLDFTYRGSDDVAALGKSADSLRLIIGEQVRQETSTYGISAGIPGTLQDTTRTYVVLSWLVHAGRDGAFDEGETSLMGETMAHEVGHYMGLFHPVESNYDAWDALDDTVDCTRARACEDDLGTNLMFPYSICYGGDCVVTEDLTPQQVAVTQRYLGAL